MTNVLEKNIAGRTMKVEFGRVGMYQMQLFL